MIYNTTSQAGQRKHPLNFATVPRCSVRVGTSTLPLFSDAAARFNALHSTDRPVPGITVLEAASSINGEHDKRNVKLALTQHKEDPLFT